MPKVYIVILNYKRWQDVIECLDSIFRLEYDNYSVIVVDNDSKNDSIEHLIRWATSGSGDAAFPFSNGTLKKPTEYAQYHSSLLDAARAPTFLPKLVFIQNENNVGFAGGNNVALRWIMHEDAYVWLLNPDMVVQPNTLSELINFVDDRHEKVIAGAIIKSYSHPDEVLFYGGGKINFNAATVNMVKELKNISELDYISGGAMLMHTRHLRDIGLLPEKYFLYWEETDWCYRAKNKGYEMQVCMTAICYDKISTTIGRSFLADFYYTRNGLMFIETFRKRNVNRALFFAFLRMGKRVVSGRWKRAKGVYKGIKTFLQAVSP